MTTLSTHVLDTAKGRPAEGIAVRLETRAGEVLDQGLTDADGRIGSIGPERLDRGAYVLRFDISVYVDGFYPEVVVVFTVAEVRCRCPAMSGADRPSAVSTRISRSREVSSTGCTPRRAIGGQHSASRGGRANQRPRNVQDLLDGPADAALAGSHQLRADHGRRRLLRAR